MDWARWSLRLHAGSIPAKIANIKKKKRKKNVGREGPEALSKLRRQHCALRNGNHFLRQANKEKERNQTVHQRMEQLSSLSPQRRLIESYEILMTAKTNPSDAALEKRDCRI